MTSLGELAVKCGKYHETYTRPLLESATTGVGAAGGGVLTQHFSGVFLFVFSYECYV